ncbi:MAG TPA: hypothetical protein PKE04_05820, partial [Clostridia bacterium]|nr:hypothetical protein [Clostridia bacterium]
MLWLDTSKAPSPLLRWTGTEWEQVGKPSIGGTNLIPNTTGDYVQAELGQNYALLGERMEMATMDLMPGDIVTCSMMLKNAANKASCARITTYASD